MVVAAFIARLYKLGITLEADGDILRCNAPKGIITPTLYAEMLQRKGELLNFLHRTHAILSTDVSNITVDLRHEVEQEAVIFPRVYDVVTNPKPNNIFLTGATGFLGAFLLHELIQSTQAKIYCLIRDYDSDTAIRRLHRMFAAYELDPEQLDARVVPIIGDLAQPSWGLSTQQFEALANDIDVIYHNGAYLNLVYPYAQLKAANVLGTRQAVLLATQNRIKPLHYISTIGVFSSGIDTLPVYEQTSIDAFGENLAIGYAQSKWVAEKIVTNARDRGLPVTIYRPGMISGDSKTGAWNTKDYLCRIIKGCLQLGCIPTFNEPKSFAPVDYVSKAIVFLSQQKEAVGQAFHMLNPASATGEELISWAHASGYPLLKVSYEEWKQALIDNTQQHTENALSPLLQIFLTDQPSSQVNPFNEDLVHYDCQQTLEALKGTSIVCPPVDFQLLRTYLAYFQRTGFLEAPAL